MSGLALSKTLDTHFMPLRLGETAHDTLQEFIDIDVSADDLVRILNRNGAYRDLFSRFTLQKAVKKEDGSDDAPSPVHRLISLLGMIGSRNLIIAIRMHKMAFGSFPVLEDGNVDIKAGDYLKKALEIEELFIRNKLDYSETAFAAAVYFDWFYKVQEKNPDFKKIEPYFIEVWKRAQKTGIIAYLLAQRHSKVAPKFALAAGILLHMGKMHLACLHSNGKRNYADVDRELDANAKLLPINRMYLELEEFGIKHEELSAYSLYYFSIFKGLRHAVRFYREPYCLKGKDSLNYSFASLLSLADSMAKSWKIPVDEKDPVFLDWSTPATKNLKFRATTLIEVMKIGMNLR